MITLTPATAIALVRKNLDEIGPNDSIMYTDEYGDNRSLSDIIVKNLPEAINAVQLAAPVTMLEGVNYRFHEIAARPEGESITFTEDGVLSFSPSGDSRFLRLVAFCASDSDIVLTDSIPEASPEGRKQLNPYIRGRYDRPRLIRLQGSGTPPSFRYYTLKDSTVESLGDPRSAIRVFSFVQEQLYDPVATEYEISRLLRQNIVDMLTAIVMETYSMTDRQQFFMQRAQTF